MENNELKPIKLDTSIHHKTTGKQPKKSFKILKIFLAVFLVLIVIFGIFGYIVYNQSQQLMAKGRTLMASARELSQAAKSQDLELAKQGLAKTRSDLQVFDSEFQKLKMYKSLPFVGAYYTDGEHILKAASYGLDAGDKALEALEPNADILGLKGGSKFVYGSAEERIQTAVKTMRVLTPKVNEISTLIENIRQEIDAIDANRYPEKFRGQEVRSKIVSVKETIDSAANLFVNAQPLIVALPEILGDPTDRRYMVIFQNDKELRATGGFITAYAIFRMEKGKLILEKSDDIYAMDASKSKKFPATPEILKFHKQVYELYIRDSNLSPDFKESMGTFYEMYQTVAGKERIDGIIAVDTHVLVEALRILGPITVYGRVFSAETDKRCDCPRAVYELEDYATRPVGYVREARKDIIGVLLREVLLMAMGVSPSQYWGRLFQMGLDEVNRKHILAYFLKPEEQKAVETFNMAGRIISSENILPLYKYDGGTGWDYLHINNSNMAGAKSNMFVSEKIIRDTLIGQDGKVTNKLTIEYKNPYAHSDCDTNKAVAGLCLNAPLRNWLRVYVPTGSTLVDSKGVISPKDMKSVPMDTYDSLGKTVFEGFLVVNPLGNAKVELTYTSPITQKDGKYNLFIQKQPGTEGQEWILTLDGKKKKQFPLISDIELSW